VREAQHSPYVLSQCLEAWLRPEETDDSQRDARAGKFVVAETIQLVRGYLTKK
jgi:hypothetical protein